MAEGEPVDLKAYCSNEYSHVIRSKQLLEAISPHTQQAAAATPAAEEEWIYRLIVLFKDYAKKFTFTS